ncbi:hypothetical protein F5Y11DRAFT_315912 [Daldinia sp. FL1419]|nr:hypothetical protein F5Y11DRAFT_315912 [Daldinia sp. FL1419]
MSLSSRLNALLAMPPSLRLAVIGAPPRIKPSRANVALKLYRSTAAWNHDEAAAFYIPELHQGRIDNVSLETLCKTSHMRSNPDEPLVSGLNTLFTKNPATFKYGETDFYKLKKNTLIPEVCVLGRSNVGKSSFVNAIAGRSQRSQNPLARISKRAGKTREMNTYGFGPVPLPKDIATWTSEVKGKEDIPAHTFYLVDMPGYGHASIEDWGRNITLYLTKRVGVKGVIILIDAEVGPKETDLQCLQLLSSANMRTCIVLTKADKVRGGLTALHDLCAKLRDDIFEIEKLQENYTWNLDRNVFVTALGARDPATIHSTVIPARFAVACQAGLVETDRPNPEKNKKWSGKIVSFDDLQYAPSDPPVNPVDKSTSAKLEWATGKGSEQHHRTKLGSFSFPHSSTITQPQVRNFHSDNLRMKNNQRGPMRQDSREMLDILDNFMNGLKATDTTSKFVRNMKRKQDRRLPLRPEKRNLLKKQDEEISKILRETYPEDVTRTQKVRQKRLASMGGRQMEENMDEWPSDFPLQSKNKKKGDSTEFMTPDAFKSIISGSEQKEITLSSQVHPQKQKGKNKSGKKSKGKAKEEPVDEFEAKFAQAFSKNL